MKILLVSESYPPITSGVSTVVAEYAQMLRTCHHSVSVITTNNSFTTSVSTIQGIKIYRIKAIKGFIRPDCPFPIPSYKEIQTIIRKERPDIIHEHSILTLASVVQRVAKHNNIPIIATVHGIPPWLVTYFTLPKIFLVALEYIFWVFLKNHLNKITHITTPSLYVKRELISHGIHVACTVLPMWIAPFPQTIPTKLTHFHFDPSVIYYCFIGRLDPDKNLPFLLHAWIYFQKLYPHAEKRKFLLVGSGKQKSLLHSIAAQDVTHSILFLGKYEEKKVYYFYQHCHFFCMSALYETQSIVTLRAISAGKTVILAHSGALPEINERYPKHVLLYNPTSQQDLIRCFTTTVKKLPKPNMTFYSQRKIVHQVCSLYKSIISATRVPSSESEERHH